MPKSTRIFDDIDHPKGWGVTYWAKRIGPLVDHIIQFSCCVAFGAIQKNHMLFFEYFKIGCMYLDKKIFIWKVWSVAMLVTIFRTVTSIATFSITTKLPKKSQKKKPSWAEATLNLGVLISKLKPCIYHIVYIDTQFVTCIKLDHYTTPACRTELVSSCVVVEGVRKHRVVSCVEIDDHCLWGDEQVAIVTTDGAVVAADWMLK